MFIMCMPFTSAEDVYTYGDLSYTINDGEITITDCDKDATGELVIPSEIDGIPVTRINCSFFLASG